MKKFLVIGASGLIGSRFVELVASEKHVTPSEEELDITSEESINSFFEKHKGDFDVCINFAAYTDVDGAEKQRGDETAIAWTLNVEGAQKVAKACQKSGKFMIHISTDFVFLGTEDNPGPYDEETPTPDFSEKIGWYGWTKSVSEKKVREVNPNSAIVRISYPFYAEEYDLKTDFAKKILELYDAGKLYPLFEDQVITPIYVDDLVKGLEKVGELEKSGVYHIVSADSTTYWDFGSYLIEKARGEEGAPEKGSMKEFLKGEGRTPRPRLGGLKTQKTQKALGMKFRTWREMVDEFVEKLQMEKTV